MKNGFYGSDMRIAWTDTVAHWEKLYITRSRNLYSKGERAGYRIALQQVAFF